MGSNSYKQLWIGAIAFAFVTMSFARSTLPMTNSPDERANLVFMERVAHRLPLAIEDREEVMADALMHPRSTTIVEGSVVPSGFVAPLYAYGLAARFFGWPMFWILPTVLTIIAGFCFAALLRLWVPWTLASLSGLLFFVHPAILYYTARGLFPNMLYSNMLIIGAWMVMRAMERSGGWRHWYSVLAGLVFGIAVASRGNEVLWIIIVAGLVLWWTRPQWTWPMIVECLGGALAILTPVLMLQHTLYGHWFAPGYLLDPHLSGSMMQQGGHSFLSVIIAAARLAIVPFGIHWRVFVHATWAYLMEYFWWWTLLGVVGAITLVRQRRDLEPHQRLILHRAVMIIIIVTAYLAMLYGHWAIVDAPEANAVTIGTSYVRYWLPLYILTIPFVAYGITVIQHMIAARGWSRFNPWFAMSIVLGSVVLVLAIPREGLLAVGETLRDGRDVITTVIQSTPPNAVIVVRSYDKWIFGLRRVIVWDQEPEKTLSVLPVIVRREPVYVLLGPEETILHPWQNATVSPAMAVGAPQSLPHGFSLLPLTSAASRLTVSPASVLASASTMKKAGDPHSTILVDNRGKSRTLPDYWMIDIPFTTQAPAGTWDTFHEEACEEASMVMVHEALARHDHITPAQADQWIHDLATWEQNHGYGVDLEARDVVDLLRSWGSVDAHVEKLQSSDQLREYLAANHLIILPAAGRLLGNPHFRHPGPLYHMLVVRGYDGKTFITNDPGTHVGEGYRYDAATLFNAAHEWNKGDVLHGAKSIIVIDAIAP